MKPLIIVFALLFTHLVHSAPKAGAHLDEQVITENGDVLLLNGAELREKF